MSEPVRVVYYPSPGKIFSPEELVEIFSQFSPKDPVILALRQIFQARFASAAIDAAAPNMSERAAGHAGGRIQEITDFRNELLGYIGGELEAPESPHPNRKRKA